MKNRKLAVLVLVMPAVLMPAVAARGEKHAIDVERSVMKIRVYKTGLFSAFAHDHEIAAPIAQGAVEISQPLAVELRVHAGKLRVLDPQLSADKRAEVQKTMEGPKVLDSSRFSEIRFQSTAIEKAGANRWTVHGMLTLHGQTHPLTADVTLQDGRYRGEATLKQREFGITPVSLAGGTVKIKNEVKVEFEIALVH
jgi:YceI-like protein